MIVRAQRNGGDGRVNWPCEPTTVKGLVDDEVMVSPLRCLFTPTGTGYGDSSAYIRRSTALSRDYLIDHSCRWLGPDSVWLGTVILA